MHFYEGKTKCLKIQPVFQNEKEENKGQALDIENYKNFMKNKLWERNFVHVWAG